MASVGAQVAAGHQNSDLVVDLTQGANQLVLNHPADPVGQAFDALFVDALTYDYVAHVAGDGSSYRQALAIPIDRIKCHESVVSVRPGNLLNIFVERSNGQLITLCLLDTAIRQIQIDKFMESLDGVLPSCIEVDVQVHALELEIAQRTGYQITIELGSVLLGSPCFYSQALPGLATSVLNAIRSKSKPLTEPVLEQSRSHLINVLSRQLESALTDFWQRLDSRIILAISRSGSTVSSTSYNLYQRLGNASRHRRLQAAEAFPLIGGLLIDPTRQFAHIRRAVDRKHALIPAVAKVLNVTQEVVRWMRNIEDTEYVGLHWLGRLDALARSLSYVCPEHRPKSINDWFAFGDFLTAIGELDTRTEGSPFKERISVLPGLLAQVGKIGWHKAWVTLANMGSDVADLADMADLIDEIVQVLADEIGGGGTLSEILVDDLLPLVKKLYCSIGITRQLRASLRWHQLMLEPVGAIEADSLSPSGSSLWSWPAPFDGFVDIEELTAVCLTNSAQLRDEGKHMKHCVRNYTDHCLYYGSSIISIRSKDGIRLSTLELYLGNKPEAPRYLVRQHRGTNNSAPPPSSITVAKTLLAILNEPCHSEKRLSINRALQERRALRRDQRPVSVDARRIERLRRTLDVHVGYARFYDEALQFVGGGG